MRRDEARLYVEEIAQRRGVSNPAALKASKEQAARIVAGLFPEQVAVITDPSKYKAAHPGRRGGKTHLCAAYLLISALLEPGSTGLYIHITRKLAKKQLWPILKRLNARHGLGASWNNSDLICTLPNGSTIMLGGCEDSSEVDKYRGDKYIVVIIDEAASYGMHLAELVEEAIEPALIDLDGTLCLVGTPANHCTGPFYEACTNGESEYSVHHWTMLANEYLPHARAWLARKRKAKGWAPDNPIYLREYMGRWVRSTESVVYWYDPDRNQAYAPDLKWTYVIGVDLGATEGVPKTAFTVSAFSEDHPTVYQRKSYKTPHMTPTEIAGQLNKLMAEYGDPQRIVMDMGALGKAIAREITKRHGIPIAPAEKREKYDYIELYNDDLKKGLIQLDPDKCKDLASEYVRLQWDEDRKLEDKRFANHCSDSALYAYRECLHWLHREAENEPEPGSDEALQREADELEQEAEERFMPDTQRDWWDRG